MKNLHTFGELQARTLLTWDEINRRYAIGAIKAVKIGDLFRIEDSEFQWIVNEEYLRNFVKYGFAF